MKLSQFEIGKTYTRCQIHTVLHGDLQSYFPHYKGKVVCGCFNLEYDPHAPHEVLIGDWPDVIKYSKQFTIQSKMGEAVPIFVKKAINRWEYQGNFLGYYSEDTKEVHAKASNAKRDNVVGVLHLTKMTGRFHLAVMATEIAGHKTLQDEFIPEAPKGRLRDWTATSKYSPGDLVFFYFGAPAKSIMGIGTVSSKPVLKNGPFYWTRKREVFLCNFKPTLLLENPVQLKRAAKAAGLNDWYDSQPYRSSRELDPVVARAILDQIVHANPEADTIWGTGPRKNKQRKRITPSVTEGGIHEVTLELRKRDPKLRIQAIAEHGYRCQICGFDFEEIYGNLGAGYIEVHHLHPLSESGKEHKVTTKEVAVLCANCHRVVHHTGKKPLPIKQVIDIVLSRKKQRTNPR